MSSSVPAPAPPWGLGVQPPEAWPSGTAVRCPRPAWRVPFRRYRERGWWPYRCFLTHRVTGPQACVRKHWLPVNTVPCALVPEPDLLMPRLGSRCHGEPLVLGPHAHEHKPWGSHPAHSLPGRDTQPRSLRWICQPPCLLFPCTLNPSPRMVKPKTPEEVNDDRKHNFLISNTVSFPRTHPEAHGKPLGDPERSSVFEPRFRACSPLGVG